LNEIREVWQNSYIAEIKASKLTVIRPIDSAFDIFPDKKSAMTISIAENIPLITRLTVNAAFLALSMPSSASLPF